MATCTVCRGTGMMNNSALLSCPRCNGTRIDQPESPTERANRLEARVAELEAATTKCVEQLERQWRGVFGYLVTAANAIVLAQAGDIDKLELAASAVRRARDAIGAPKKPVSDAVRVASTTQEQP